MTANFHNVNSDSIYVIYEQDSSQLGESLANDDFVFNDTINSRYELIGYPAISIGSYWFDFNISGIKISTLYDVFIREGYYEYSNLDYEISYRINDNNNDDYWEDVDDMVNDIFADPETFKIENASITETELTDFVNDKIKENTVLVNRYLAQVSEQYEVVAQFSNGETIYRKKKGNQ